MAEFRWMDLQLENNIRNIPLILLLLLKMMMTFLEFNNFLEYQRLKIYQNIPKNILKKQLIFS